MAIPWLWILGGGAVAGAGAWFFTQKKAQAAPPSLPPYQPPVPAPQPVPQPQVIFVPTPPAPSEIRPVPAPLPVPTPPTDYGFKPVSPTSNLQTVPTVYEAKQGQPGPSGTPVPLQMMTVTTQSDPLNLRDAPNGKVIGQLPKGSQFAVDAYQGDWAHGRSQAGQVGWASRQFLGGTYGAATESFSSNQSVSGAAERRRRAWGGGHRALFLEGFKTGMQHTMNKPRRARGIAAKAKG